MVSQKFSERLLVAAKLILHEAKAFGVSEVFRAFVGSAKLKLHEAKACGVSDLVARS